MLLGHARTAACSHRALGSEEGLGSPCTWKTSRVLQLVSSYPSAHEEDKTQTHLFLINAFSANTEHIGCLALAVVASLVQHGPCRHFLRMQSGVGCSWRGTFFPTTACFKTINISTFVSLTTLVYVLDEQKLTEYGHCFLFRQSAFLEKRLHYSRMQYFLTQYQ